MGAKSHICRWVTSVAVRIPKSIAGQWGVQEGPAIEIVPCGDQVVLRKRSSDLSSMLGQINPHNLHSGQDFGPSRGSEEW